MFPGKRVLEFVTLCLKYFIHSWIAYCLIAYVKLKNGSGIDAADSVVGLKTGHGCWQKGL